MWLYPEIQAIWKSLKLVLSLFNDTFRQNPNKPFETLLWITVCSGVLFLVRGDQVSVLIWISCMNSCTLPVKPSQTFVTNSQINLEKAALLPFHFFNFIKRWRAQTCRSSHLEMAVSSCGFSTLNPTSPASLCCAAREKALSLLFFL